MHYLPFILMMRGGTVSVGHPSVGHEFVHVCLSNVLYKHFSVCGCVNLKCICILMFYLHACD